MSKRKISECINIRINVGNYQHIELTKYAEEGIEFSSDSDRIEKEDGLRDDLVASIMRSMKAIPERLGKGIDQAIEVEEAIQKAIPAWLENGPVPNIANGAKEKVIKVTAEQKDNKDSQIPVVDTKIDKEDVQVEVVKTSESTTSVSEEDVHDLFEDDAPSTNTEAKKEVEKEKDVDPSVKNDLKEFFDEDDDDLFSDV